MSESNPVLISRAELKDRYGLDVSRVTIWKMIKGGTLPRPITLVSGATKSKLLWHKDEMDAAIAKLGK
jgi:predicted DNA-binding transcriptional regulator AlpA